VGVLLVGFEEPVKIAVISLIGSGFLMAYLSSLFSEDHLPVKLLFVLLAVLMIPLSIGLSIRGLEEQGGDSPSANQQSVIKMADRVYVMSLFVFVFFLGYSIVNFIIWTLNTIRTYKEKKHLTD
jgi:hypothetical protein